MDTEINDENITDISNNITLATIQTSNIYSDINSNEFNNLNSQKTREFLQFVFGTITPEIYEALKFKLEFENNDQKIEFLKYTHTY